ncbi:MAG: NUDIX domain-containing protein [Gammaproteobacteria bacterium]
MKIQMKVKMLSAGMVITHELNHECRYLLLRAYNYWDFPKGIVESTEDPFEAARREVEEETSLRSLDFPWGQVFCETEPYGAGKVARYYLAATREVAVTLAVSMELGRREHDEYRWLHYGEARALLSARLIAILDWARELSGC